VLFYASLAAEFRDVMSATISAKKNDSRFVYLHLFVGGLRSYCVFCLYVCA
jgi:hypothetical protein